MGYHSILFRPTCHSNKENLVISALAPLTIVIFIIRYVFHRSKKCKEYQRIFYSCIVPGCNDSVRNLSRHLNSRKHGWSKESAKAAVNMHGIRKPYCKQNPSQLKSEKKDSKEREEKAKLKLCPIPTCMSVVKRLDVHLRLSHSMNRDSSYYALLHSVNTFAPITDLSTTSPKKRVKSDTMPHNLPSRKSCMSDVSVPRRSIDLNLPIPITSKTICVPDLSPEQELVAPVDTIPSENIGESIEEKSDCFTGSSENDPNYYPDTVTLISQKDLTVTCSMHVESVLEKFLIYLCGVDRGSKPLESAKQIVADVRRALTAIHAEELEELFDGDCLRDKYLMGYCVKKNHSALSIRKYLRSLIDFLSFLIVERIPLSVTSNDIIRMKEKLALWSKNYKTAANSRYWERQIEDYEVLVTPEHVQVYEKSEHAMKAKELFKTLKVYPREVTSDEFWCMRDHLFAVIHFSNSHRSGVSAGMKLKEFQTAKRIAEHFIIYVREHKTFSTSGPAMMTLMPLEFSWLQTYVAVRPQITDSPYVFTSWSGKKLRSGAVSRQINSMWKKAGLKEGNEKSISCNIIRKSTSTGLRDVGAGGYQELADLMGHSIATQQKHYALRKKQQSAGKAATAITSYYYENSGEQLPPPESSALVSPSKKQWTIAEIEEIREIFNEDITNGTVSMKQVAARLEHLSVNATQQQVYDKLKSMLRYSPQKNLAKYVPRPEPVLTPVSNFSFGHISNSSRLLLLVLVTRLMT